MSYEEALQGPISELHLFKKLFDTYYLIISTKIHKNKACRVLNKVYCIT
jgi:hypothetical protein